MSSSIIKFIYSGSKVSKISDGDTFEAYTMLTFDHRVKTKIRLARIDCPERGEDGWLPAKEFTTALLRNTAVDLHVLALDNWKRWICEVYLNGENVSDLLLATNHAVIYKRGR